MSHYKDTDHVCPVCVEDIACRYEQPYLGTGMIYPEVCIGCFKHGWRVWNTLMCVTLELEADEFFWSYFVKAQG